MYNVRKTNEHMIAVVQKDGSDKYVLLGTNDQAEQLTRSLNFADQVRGWISMYDKGTITDFRLARELQRIYIESLTK